MNHLNFDLSQYNFWMTPDVCNWDQRNAIMYIQSPITRGTECFILRTGDGLKNPYRFTYRIRNSYDRVEYASPGFYADMSTVIRSLTMKMQQLGYLPTREA